MKSVIGQQWNFMPQIGNSIQCPTLFKLYNTKIPCHVVNKKCLKFWRILSKKNTFWKPNDRVVS